jgi:hypothetical protein
LEQLRASKDFVECEESSEAPEFSGTALLDGRLYKYQYVHGNPEKLLQVLVSDQKVEGKVRRVNILRRVVGNTYLLVRETWEATGERPGKDELNPDAKRLLLRKRLGQYEWTRRVPQGLPYRLNTGEHVICFDPSSFDAVLFSRLSGDEHEVHTYSDETEWPT